MILEKWHWAVSDDHEKFESRMMELCVELQT